MTTEPQGAPTVRKDQVAHVLHQIEAYPQRYDQRHCLRELPEGADPHGARTAGCPAGIAVRTEMPFLEPIWRAVLYRGRAVKVADHMQVGTEPVYLHDLGQALLGLTEEQADYLFDYNLPRRHVVAALEELLDRGTMTFADAALWDEEDA